jgi:hypothetical protein
LILANNSDKPLNFADHGREPKVYAFDFLFQPEPANIIEAINLAEIGKPI